MIILTKEAKCDCGSSRCEGHRGRTCDKQLDIVEGMEWVPYHGIFCQSCADNYKSFFKVLADIEKERNKERSYDSKGG